MLTPDHRPAFQGTWAKDEAHGGGARFALEDA